MNTEQSDIVTKLAKASEGLLFQSESDYPFQPFLWEGEAAAELTPQELLALTHSPSDAPVVTTSLARFFRPAIKEQAWHNAEERESVKRFQELVKTLKGTLKSITVFKVGKGEVDVYIVGKTKTGDLAGLSTKVVET